MRIHFWNSSLLQCVQYTFTFTYPILMFAFAFKYVLCVLFCLSHIRHLFRCFSIIFVYTFALVAISFLFFCLPFIYFAKFHIFAWIRLHSRKVEIGVEQKMMEMEQCCLRNRIENMLDTIVCMCVCVRNSCEYLCLCNVCIRHTNGLIANAA